VSALDSSGRVRCVRCVGPAVDVLLGGRARGHRGRVDDVITVAVNEPRDKVVKAEGADEPSPLRLRVAELDIGHLGLILERRHLRLRCLHRLRCHLRLHCCGFHVVSAAIRVFAHAPFERSPLVRPVDDVGTVPHDPVVLPLELQELVAALALGSDRVLLAQVLRGVLGGMCV